MRSTFVWAIGITLVLSAWLVSGQFQSTDERLGSQGEKAADALVSVRAETRTAQSHVVQITVRGKTQAKRSVTVKAQTGGRVEILPIEKGSAVKQGDLLCQLALEDRRIKLQEATAAVAHARLEHEGAKKLKQQGYQSQTAIAATQVKLINAQAQLKARQLDLTYLQIRAPFAGVVQERPADIGDLLERGGVCAEVLDPDPMLVVGHVTEQEVEQISLGDVANVLLNNGRSEQGVITFISHAADLTTRTYRIEVAISNADAAIRDGLSAVIAIARAAVMAHQVSPALLSLDDAGLLGIRILDDEDRIQYLHVDIVSDTQQGIWVTGLPQIIRLVTVGQEMVFEGQRVEVVETIKRG